MCFRVFLSSVQFANQFLFAPQPLTRPATRVTEVREKFKKISPGEIPRSCQYIRAVRDIGPLMGGWHLRPGARHVPSVGVRPNPEKHLKGVRSQDIMQGGQVLPAFTSFSACYRHGMVYQVLQLMHCWMHPIGDWMVSRTWFV